MRTTFARASVVLAAAFILSIGDAAADPFGKPSNVEATEKLNLGTRLYRVREFEKAIEEYKAGALKEDAPAFHYNLGQCYRLLGRYDEAIWHYERFLSRHARKTTPKIVVIVEGFINDMKAELNKKVMTRPPVEPAPDPQTAATEPAQVTPTVVTVVDPASPWYSDGVGWGLAGTGLASSGIAMGLLVSAQGLDEDANRETRQEIKEALHERADSRRLIGAVVGIGGGALLMTGIIKLAIAPKARERTVQTSLGIGATRNGIAIVGRF
ncbi:MAG: tetratricopeptide repeat protein [Kofleriaceae bacterium]